MADRHVSTMTFLWLVQTILLLSMVDFSIAQGNQIPIISDYSAINNRYLPENLPIGYNLGTILATASNGRPVTFVIQDSGGEYFAINSSGIVILKKRFDFELVTEVKSVLVVTDQNGQSNRRDCKVFVDDVNDNLPVFSDPAIFRSIPENAPIGYNVTAIEVTDIDFMNSQIKVVCTNDTELFAEACNTFRLVVTTSTNRYWRGFLVLSKTLDYEIKVSYNIRLMASDGDNTHNVMIEVHVEVIDINDAPPKWSYAGPKSIPEEEPIGTLIQIVTAVDGDLTNHRPIFYSLTGPNTNLFKIDSNTGVISNAIRLDYDSSDQEKGLPYDVIVMACEVVNTTTGQLGNDSKTCSTLSLKVTIYDINDNGPTFSQKQYNASVYENTVTDANVPGLQMTVTDIDSGTYNSFNLVILNNTDVFGILPATDSALSSATIYIKNGTKIDYETGPRQYIIDVLAIQNFQDNKMYTGSATVTINVVNVNDESPMFGSQFYNASVIETATPGTGIIVMNATDREQGQFGTAGIRYILYGDSTPPHFQINPITGAISVAPCNAPYRPGLAPCIDYEGKKEYTLTVSASDNFGNVPSRKNSVPVTINILDDNDNPPKVDASYTRYIYEEQMVPINGLLIEPIDPDTVGGPITCTIVGDGSGLWQVTEMTKRIDNTDRQYWNITANRRIVYSDARFPSGEFNFNVLVQDKKFPETATVKIIVIDINNNDPYFTRRQFSKDIPETTLGGVYVITVTASDADTPTTGNGILDFSIQSGAQGKFTIANVTNVYNQYVADIYTTRDAKFNYETQNVYNMYLIVQDRGTPNSRSGAADLTIIIIDENNKDPQIVPSFQSVNVYENELVGITVYQVTASDPDVNNKLTYYMTAVQATDGAGDNVNSSTYDFTRLFRMEESTGNVIVNYSLDRDNTSRITYDLIVKDINASPPQTGYGTFLIHILEYNDQAPQFDLPFYNITIDEEMNINSFVENLNCRDVDDKINGYTITQTNPGTPVYFALLTGSGTMIVSERVDYEKIERITLTASCTDSGQPTLTNTTQIVVFIVNINDNTPIFQQNVYRTSIRENTVGGTLNVTLIATDLDKGDYGVVRYRLEDPYGFFEINATTGVITILPNAKFDREKAAFLAFQAVAYDSPLDLSVSRSSTVEIYVIIEDVNDNCPIFDKTSYQGKVPESANIDTDIIDCLVTDADDGINAMVVFAVKNGSGNPPDAENIFGVSSVGRVFVRDSLKGKIRLYSLNITATDMNGEYPGLQCTREVPIQIEVQRSDNNAPEWIRPPNRNTVIYVLEDQYRGMLVYNAKAADNDVGLNGVVDYYFSVSNGSLSATSPEFRINRVTGVIRAEVVFDREQLDKYFLTLVAKDKGIPSARSETTLTVFILDVNDNEPIFPMKDGAVIPLELLHVSESVPIPDNKPGYILGSCQAADADSDTENNLISYDLLGNEVSNYIYVDRNTCDIYLKKHVDFETMPELRFNILAYNEKNDDSVKRYKRDVSPSILPVIVLFDDSNDNPPVFVQQNYSACVSVDASYQQNILVVSATDKDAGDNTRIVYSLIGTQAFQINSKLGVISNIVSLNSQTIYKFYAVASDGVSSSTAAVTIFLTSKSNAAVLKVNRPLNDVLPFKQQFIKAFMNTPGSRISYACVVDMKNHVDGSGQESSVSTDVYVSAFIYEENQYIPYSAGSLVVYVNKERQQEDSPFNAIYVADAKEETQTDSFILQEDAVLAVFIICILLIFLAILLLCIACFCIRNSNRKKLKSVRAASHTIGHVQEPLETSINPVYNIEHTVPMNENVEYSTVQKVRPIATAVSPVIIPAAYPTDDDDYSPIEPPRAYLDEPEPVIETFIEPEPEFETYIEPEPVIETYIDPEPVIETYIEPEPVIETYIEPVSSPVPDRDSPRHFEPEYDDRIEDEVHDRIVPEVYHHVSSPRIIEEDEIDASIRDSPPESLRSSIRNSPPSVRHSTRYSPPPSVRSNGRNSPPNSQSSNQSSNHPSAPSSIRHEPEEFY